jgi:hypothetical protein
MPEMADPLTVEFLTWISRRPRTYAEAMQAWRSNCPRHSVWEDAFVEGLIEVVECGETMDEGRVKLTMRGWARLGGQPAASESVENSAKAPTPSRSRFGNTL